MSLSLCHVWRIAMTPKSCIERGTTVWSIGFFFLKSRVSPIELQQQCGATIQNVFPSYDSLCKFNSLLSPDRTSHHVFPFPQRLHRHKIPAQSSPSDSFMGQIIADWSSSTSGVVFVNFSDLSLVQFQTVLLH